MKHARSWSSVAVVALIAGALPLLTETAASANPPAPIVVTGGDISSDGSSGWAVESRNGGTGEFVTGTGTTPLGTGSYHLASHAIGDKQFLHLTKVAGVSLLGRPITDITALSFESYASDGTFSPYVNIPIHSAFIDTNSDGVADGDQPGVPGATGNAVLVYEPTVPGGSWGLSDTITPTATWRLTRPVVSGGTTPLWTYKTWAAWESLLTDAIVNPVYGDIQWSIGDTSSAAWSGREGWIDDITVTTTTETATYDLEEGLGSCPVSIDTPSKTLTMTGDCTTSKTLTLHDGWTLDGAGHTITVVDPSSGSFTGAALTNGGSEMHVTDVHLVGNLADGCSASLYGIQFNAASGSLTHSTVSGIRYGSGSGCQSGNSVDITNLGGPTRLAVTIDDVQVTTPQKTGIRANGNVALRLTNSSIASSDLDLITASNSLQVSRGARAYVADNTIEGNDWDGNTDWNATGVLLYGAEDVTFIRNVITGTDTDVGLYVADTSTYPEGRTTLTCNLIRRNAAADSTPSPGTALDIWDIGVAADEDLTAKIDATGNTVLGFTTPWQDVDNELGGPCASGSVQGLALSGDNTSLTADWSAPVALPYAPVTSYDVTLIPGGATQTVSGTSATFAITPGKDFTVTVAPHSAAGRGTARSASLDTALPGRPSGLTAAGSTTSAKLGWSVSTSPTPISTYTIVATPPSGPVVTKVVSASGLTFPVTVTGLATHRAYTFSVMATNAFGTGAATARTLQGTGVSLSLTKHPVVYGGWVTIRGRVIDTSSHRSVRGQTVTLKVRPAGATTYHTVIGATVTSHVNGSFSLRYRPTANSRIYVQVTGAGRMAATTRQKMVWVQATSTLKASHTTVKAGSSVTFSGSVKPGKGTVVELQHKVGTHWVVVRTLTVRTSAGRWQLGWRATARVVTTWRVRVVRQGLRAGYSHKQVLVVI